MKCKKCAGDLPHGAYGKVKCEYCNTVNNVPTPEQEREKKVEVEEASGKKWMTAAVVIVMLGIVGSVTAFVPLVSVQESYTTTETQYKPVSYQEKEPYTVQEAYTEKEPYTDTEITYKEESYKDQECEWVYPKFDDKYIGWGPEDDYTWRSIVEFINGEDQSISLTITMSFDRWNDELGKLQSVDTDTKSFLLKPYETKEVTFSSSIPRNEPLSTFGIVKSEAKKIEKCKTVTKFKEVPETQTVTKYRTATKYQDVTKYRTVTKTKQEPYQAQVAKTRAVKKTLFEYLLS